MTKNTLIFDPKKAKQTSKKGSGQKWIKRKGTKAKGFYYEDKNGKKITDEKILE